MVLNFLGEVFFPGDFYPGQCMSGKEPPQVNRVVECSSSLITEAMRCLRPKDKLTGHSANKCEYLLGVRCSEMTKTHGSLMSVNSPVRGGSRSSHQAILMTNLTFNRYFLSTYQVLDTIVLSAAVMLVSKTCPKPRLHGPFTCWWRKTDKISLYIYIYV